MANTKKKSNKISKYRRNPNINVGMIMFGVIFIYVIICIFSYFTTEHIVGYEVQKGSLYTNNTYKGIALRSEELVTSTNSGYISYYAREGQRVAVGDLVYAIDESGKLSDYFSSADLGENSLSSENLSELRGEIVDFTGYFDPKDFSSTYSFKYDVQGTVLKLANNSILDSIGNLSESGITDIITMYNASKSGIVVYSIDGFENKTVSELTEDDFNTKNYEKTQLSSNELVESGDPVYKLEKSEDWSIVIQVDEEKAQELLDEEYVKVKFLKDQTSSWAYVTIHNNADGNIYAELSFTNSMIAFCTDRFIDIELQLDVNSGLKIPNTSIVEKNFFLVSTDYVIQGGDSSDYGVMRQTFLEDGTMSTEFVETSIYSEVDGEYYLDTSALQVGDVIYKPDSTETYTISKQGTLIGVYNINKGYADFREINILYQNEEYSIVESNTTYGLRVYDYIVLDASTVDEDDFIYN